MTNDVDPKQYPEGKLNAEDDGALTTTITHAGGKVHIIFPKPVAWIAFGPDQAMEIAQSLIEHARAIGLTKPCILKL